MQFKEQSGLARRSLGEGGQALLIIVLIMVVALTVGLSLGSRTIINIRSSSEEADSQKALAAAEAGIEKALQETGSTPIGGSFIENNTTYSGNVEEVKGDSFFANGGNLVVQDDGVDVWLVKHDDVDGKPNYSAPWTGEKLTIYWGDPSLDDCSNAALEVAVISGSIASPVLTREAFDPCTVRRNTNKFSNVGRDLFPITIGNEAKNFLYKKGIKDISSGLVARVVPIYASTQIAIETDVELPTQGFAIDSTGKSGSGDREVFRSLTFFRTFDQVVTAHFMYGLFTP